MNTYEIISTIGKGETKMNIAEIYQQRSEHERLLETMEELKEALEKIANLATGESAKIACEALDSVYPIKGAAK